MTSSGPGSPPCGRDKVSNGASDTFVDLTAGAATAPDEAPVFGCPIHKVPLVAAKK